MKNQYCRWSAFDRNAKIVLASGKTPQIWDIASGQMLLSLPVSDFADYYAEWDLALTPKGDIAVASFSHDLRILVWETEKGKEISRWKLGCVATGMAVTNKLVLIGANISKMLVLCDLDTGDEIFRVKTKTSATETVCISDDGKYGLSGGGDKRIRLWDLKNGKIIQEIVGHTGRVQSLDFGPMNKTAVSGSSDKTVRVWNLENGQELACFRGIPRIVDCVAFAANGQHVAAGSRDGIVRVWNLDNGNQQIFQGHTCDITSVAFRPNCKTLVSASLQEVWKWTL